MSKFPYAGDAREPVEIVDCHAAGEVGHVIVSGVPTPPGDTVWEQALWIAQDNRLRNFVLNEPRGGVFNHVNLLVPAVAPEAAWGFIIMEPEDTPPMSGSNSICVATVLLETGRVPMEEPQTRFTMEAPGGLVRVVADCDKGRVRRVTLRNMPSFADALDSRVEVAGFGTVGVDTAFGGDSFAIVSATELGFSLVSDEARDLCELGGRIRAAAEEQIGFQHPTLAEMKGISFCLFVSPVTLEEGVRTSTNATIVRPGKVDRSPTGTALSARMAVMHARGEMTVGEALRTRSIIGSEFLGRIETETLLNEMPAILPTVSGTAWITGKRELLLAEDDPWPEGYRLSDTWPLMPGSGQ
ncbi:MAG: proline racemase family protein [Pseudomonadota bacterium]